MRKDDIAVIVVLAVVGILWLNFCAGLDLERNKISYCWDDQGEHYVAPDIHCTH